VKCFLHVFKPFNLTVVEKLDYFKIVTSARIWTDTEGVWSNLFIHWFCVA